ncbi:MAG: heparin lyase I family protein, partial [Porticoccus sp.]
CAVKLEIVKAQWPPPAPAPSGYGPRAQLNKVNTYLPIKQENEYWFGWSTFFPSVGWGTDSYVNNTVWMQLHWSGGTGGTPPITLDVTKNTYSMSVRTGELGNLNKHTVWSQEGMERDTWIDWVVRVIPSSSSTGVIQLWKNGVLVGGRHNAANLFYDGKRNLRDDLYLAMVIYKPKYITRPSSLDRMKYYIDEVRVAEGPHGFHAVSPGSPPIPANWAAPGALYNYRTHKYDHGGFVWQAGAKCGPKAKAELKAWFGPKVSMDTLSLVGNKDPAYSTFYDEHVGKAPYEPLLQPTQ